MISQRILKTSLLLIGLVALAGCSGGQQATTAAPPPAATATSASASTAIPPTATAVGPTAIPVPPTATTAPAATATQAGEKVTFEFVAPLSTIEELDPLLAAVEDVEGVLGASGSQVDITITYDPAVITVEELQAKMAEIGQPVKEPGS